MKKLTGHIITGLQKCEERNIIYRAYVLKEHGKDIDILDQEHLDDWIANFGQMGRLIRTEGALVSVSSVRSTAPWVPSAGTIRHAC